MTGRRPEPVYLELLPAVDVAGGRAVQAAREEPGARPLDDPIQAALRWQADGAEWIHLVDLDAAFGRGHNRELLANVVGAVDLSDVGALGTLVPLGLEGTIVGTALYDGRFRLTDALRHTRERPTSGAM